MRGREGVRGKRVRGGCEREGRGMSVRGKRVREGGGEREEVRGGVREGGG